MDFGAKDKVLSNVVSAWGKEGKGKKGSGGEEDLPKSSDTLTAATNAVFKALKSGDKAAFKSALKAAISACMEDDGEEDEEEEEDEDLDEDEDY